MIASRLAGTGCRLLAVLSLACTPAHGSQAQIETLPAASGPAPAWSAEGAVFAFLSSRIDYVGVSRLRRFVSSPLGRWRLGLETVVPVRSVSGRGAVIMDDLDYTVEVALERGFGSGIWSPFVAARGSQEVDERGSRGVLLLGLRMGQPDQERRFAWEIEAAAAAAEWGIDARGWIGTAAEWRALRRVRWETGLRARIDALWLEDADHLESDLAAGPFLRLRRPGGLRLSVQALYYRGRNPLGLQETGVLVGVHFEDTEPAASHEQQANLEAALMGGGGNDRVRAYQLLDLSSSAFSLVGRAWRLRLVAENVLLNTRLNDIYYILQGGMERASGALRPGFYFYHRSGHLLNQPNSRRLSLNVLEAGVRTPRWRPDLPAWPGSGASSRLSGEARIGLVVSSEFGERQRWISRAGMSWVLPGRWRRLAPFVGARAQKGEVKGWAAQAGFVAPRDLSVSVLAERDSQRLERRDTSWVLMLGRRF